MESDRHNFGTAIGRAITGVFAGYLVFGVSAVAMFKLTNHDPHAPASVAFMTGSIVYGVLFASVGGYLAQTIAARRDLRATYALAILLAVIATVSALAKPGNGAWSALAALLLMAPAVVVGGIIRARSVGR